MRIDMMTDIETLGQRADATIFQISAATFNIETGEILDTFTGSADIALSPVTIEGGTLKWWMKTNPTLFNRLLNEGDQSPVDLLKNFHQWMRALTDNKDNDLYLWGKGILFDNKMIAHQFEQQGLDYPIYFRNDRDVRTIIELACVKKDLSMKQFYAHFNDETLTLHDAEDDVMNQIRMVSQCYRWLTE